MSKRVWHQENNDNFIISRDFAKRGQSVLFFNMRKSVENVFTGTGETDMVIVRGYQELQQRLAGESLCIVRLNMHQRDDSTLRIVLSCL